MAKYYVNKNAQDNGDHEVHEAGCRWLPEADNRQSLGIFTTCSEALKEAKKYYSQVDGCYYCCNPCHKS